MQNFAFICALLLSACQTHGQFVDDLPTPEVSRSQTDDTGFVQSIAARIMPAATAICRDTNPGKAASFCEFRVSVDSRPGKSPNATHSVSPDGRPLLTFTQSLIDAVENEDELAFVVAHEASHQIANHHQRLSGGSVVLRLSDTSGHANTAAFQLSRANLKALELEADIIATVVLNASGFSPEQGAKAIRKFAGHTSEHSKTHPPVLKRETAVAKAIAIQRAGHDISFAQ